MDNISLTKLYPHLSDAERSDAQENLRAYLTLVIQIHERIRLDPAYQKLCTLTGRNRNPKLAGERSKRKKRTLTSKGP